MPVRAPCQLKKALQGCGDDSRERIAFPRRGVIDLPSGKSMLIDAYTVLFLALSFLSG